MLLRAWAGRGVEFGRGAAVRLVVWGSAHVAAEPDAEPDPRTLVACDLASNLVAARRCSMGFGLDLQVDSRVWRASSRRRWLARAAK